MEYTLPTETDLIEVNDQFATLMGYDESTGDLDFEFRYSIRQSTVVKRNLTKVMVTVTRRTYSQRPLQDARNNRDMIRNILFDAVNSRSMIDGGKKYISASKASDPTSKLNNSAIAQLKSGRSIEEIPSFRRTRLIPQPAEASKSRGENSPILQQSVSDSFPKFKSTIDDVALKNLRKEILSLSGKDPSSVFTRPPNVTTDYQVLSGLPGRIDISEPWSKDFNLYNAYVENYVTVSEERTSGDVSDEKLINVMVSESLDMMTVPVRVMFKQKEGTNTINDVFVKFEVIDASSGNTVQAIIKPLSVNKHIRIFNTPIKPPHVQVTKKSFGDKVTLSIKQKDPAANSVVVFKKKIYSSQPNENETPYSYVGTYPANTKYASHIAFKAPSNKTMDVYRCIPARNGKNGSSFVNAVVREGYHHDKTIVLTSKTSEAGIILEAKNIPPDVVSLYFMHKNVSIKEKNYSLVSPPISINETIRQSDFVSVVAQNLKQNNVYDFTIKCLYKDGLFEYSSKDIVKYIEQTPGKVSINLQNLQVEGSEEIDVKFNVDMEVTEGDIDFLVSLLNQSDAEKYFSEDIKKQRDQLKSLLAYKVERIDLSNRDKEHLGIFMDPNFSDKKARQKSGAKPLQAGKSYRYIVSVLMRSPETLMPSYIKQVQDPITKKNFNFSPSKFSMPTALRTGTLSNVLEDNTTTGFEDGIIGSSFTVDVKINSTFSNVLDAKAEIFDKQHVLISWKVDGKLEDYDHFVVIKESYGQGSIIGCAHTQTSSNNCFWIHKFDKSDQGQVRYRITPILSDYGESIPLITNSLILEVN